MRTRTIVTALLTAMVLAVPAAAAEKRRLLALETQFDASAADGQTPEIEAANRARVAATARRIADHLKASPITSSS